MVQRKKVARKTKKNAGSKENAGPKKNARTKKNAKANKARTKNAAVKPVEIQGPADVAFLRPIVDAAYLKKPAHLRKRKDRYEAGRSFRVKCPREDHAELTIAQGKKRDPIGLLIESSEGRLTSLLPIRYGRMLASPFAFFRGSAVIMAADLANSPSTDYAVQACGDCHLLNFGAFATPERHVVFDINDFDETFPAPWEWDLKRLAASFFIAGEHNKHSNKDIRLSVMQLVQAYRDKLRELADMPTLSAWYSYLDYETLIDLSETAELKRRRKKVLERELNKDALHEFIKLGHVIAEQPRIKDRPPLVFHHDEQKEPDFQEKVDFLLASYRESLPLDRRVLFDRYELADTAIKVVGVGSVGTYCSIGLFFAAEKDPLFLQLKEARNSVLEPFVDLPPFQTNGERVVFGQRLMQAASDIFLGHAQAANGKHFYMRQLRDVKVKPMVELFNPREMVGYARNCGWALAMAHARSGDPVILSGYIGKSDVLPNAIATFAEVYAKQNLVDYKELVKAVKSGQLEAFSEV
jgi:uncharacterized protein (DUF2252 family)